MQVHFFTFYVFQAITISLTIRDKPSYGFGFSSDYFIVLMIFAVFLDVIGEIFRQFLGFLY